MGAVGTSEICGNKAHLIWNRHIRCDHIDSSRRFRGVWASDKDLGAEARARFPNRSERLCEQTLIDRGHGIQQTSRVLISIDMR